jgi:uncharacterized membrane protein
MRIGDLVFSDPWVVYLLIPLIFLLIYLLRKKFVREEERLFKSKGRKRMTLLFKALFFALLLIALSNPVIEQRDVSGNLTKVKVLVDKSYSMQLLDVEKAMETINAVELPVEIKELEMEDYSSLGTGILSNLESSQNVLVITDGQNNFGADLKDVAVFASTLGVRLYGLKLESREDDAAIFIDGPAKVVSGVENTFKITIREVGNVGEKDVRVLVDNNVAFEGVYRKPIEIRKTFDGGTHYIEAILDEDDHFQENNRFFKAVNVMERPKILFLSRYKSPLQELYDEFYEVDVMTQLPANMTPYHAAVIDNMELSEDSVNILERFLNDENGVLVVGGKESYDWGNYNTSSIMGILPVEIGKARKQKDIVSIIIVMDTGASGSELLSSGVAKFDVQKALAVDVIKSISSQNKVGFIEANFYLNTLTGLSELGPKRAQLANDIALLKSHGLSELRFAYEKAHESLRLSRGSRNIVIITDGKLIPQDQAITLDMTQKAHDDGIKTFIIGVGDSADEEFLMAMKEAGGGEYFRTDDSQRIKLYFGDASENPDDDLGIFVYDSNHFITKDISKVGKIYGFNSVYPKANARMLLTTSTGDPLLTIWNFGLGRVASLTTDDGSMWNPDMLAEANSKVLIKTLNWLVENPERKNLMSVDIEDLRIGENAVVVARSQSRPEGNYFAAGKNLYKSNLFPEEVGFIEVSGVSAGVNYKKEYLHIGISEDLEKAIAITGGQMLPPDAAQIEEKIMSASSVETVRQESVSWAFFAAALAVFLIEIFLKRIQMIRSSGEY